MPERAEGKGGNDGRFGGKKGGNAGRAAGKGVDDGRSYGGYGGKKGGYGRAAGKGVLTGRFAGKGLRTANAAASYTDNYSQTFANEAVSVTEKVETIQSLFNGQASP